MADTLSTLEQIRIKVRRLTKSPSVSQISNDTIDDYVNSFVLYDFPESLRLAALKKTLTFYTEPYHDVYTTTTADATDPLYNFKNRYITIDSPIYIDGSLAYLSKSPAAFYGNFPNKESQYLIGTGNGVTTIYTGYVGANTTSATKINTGFNTNGFGNVAGVYVRAYAVGDRFSIGAEIFTVTALGEPAVLDTTGASIVHTLNTTTGAFDIQGSEINSTLYFYPLNPAVNYTTDTHILPNKVLFSAVNVNNNGIQVHDDGAGNLVGDTGADSTIDYITGAYDVTFNIAPKNGSLIYAFVYPYTASMPSAVLFYDNEFTLRPVPDRPYRVEVTVYQRPTALAAGESPELTQWWQYIALGAAKKIFQDRMDLDSVAMIEPELQQQELLVNRRTINAQTNSQVATIFNTGYPVEELFGND